MSCRDDEKNKSALEYSLEMVDDVSSISGFFTQPLGLTTFGYKRVYKDGQYMFLSTNRDWLKYHYQNIKDHGTFFQEAMSAAHLNHSYNVLWPCVPEDHFLQALNYFGMWHGVNFYKWRGDYLELWTFSTSCDRNRISQLYFNTLPYFENFIHHFNLKASEIVDVSNKEKLAKFEQNSFTLASEISSLPPISQIIDQIKIDKFLVEGPNGIITLTKRESECIRLLCMGKKVKEVANILMISPRTVETYVNQVKEKTGCPTTSKLLETVQSPK
jgi:DNA-binding CsgD family transcriptional regulator